MLALQVVKRQSHYSPVSLQAPHCNCNIWYLISLPSFMGFPNGIVPLVVPKRLKNLLWTYTSNLPGRVPKKLCFILNVPRQFSMEPWSQHQHGVDNFTAPASLPQVSGQTIMTHDAFSLCFSFWIQK